MLEKKGKGKRNQYQAHGVNAPVHPKEEGEQDCGGMGIGLRLGG